MGRFSEKKKGSLASLKDKADNDNNNINSEVNSNTNKDTNKPVLKKEEKSKKILIGLYYDEEQANKLDELVKKTGKSKSEIGRLAMDYFYENVEIR